MLRMTKIKHDWRQDWINCRKSFQRERENEVLLSNEVTFTGTVEREADYDAA